MSDFNKVVSGIEMCMKSCGMSECPYWNGSISDESCIENLLKDSLAILKEREAVAPEVEVLNEIDRFYRCPRCHKCYFYEHQKFCDCCGQAVKWE